MAPLFTTGSSLRCRLPSLGRPTDISVPLTDYGELVSSLNSDMRACIGLLTVQRMPFWPGTERAELTEEVVSGKSTVLQDRKEDFQCVVFVATLRVERADGCVLIRPGK